MHPFDEESERSEGDAGSERRSGLTIIVILGIVALVVIAIVAHLLGGAPTHGR